MSSVWVSWSGQPPEVGSLIGLTRGPEPNAPFDQYIVQEVKCVSSELGPQSSGGTRVLLYVVDPIVEVAPPEPRSRFARILDDDLWTF